MICVVSHSCICEGKQEQLTKQTCDLCVMKELRLIIINQNKSSRENVAPLQHGSALHSIFTHFAPHVAE